MNNRGLMIATTGVFVSGNALFAMSLRAAPATVVLAGCAGVLAMAASAQPRSPDGFLARPIAWRALILCFFVALTLFIVGGEGHFLHTTNDWLIRDAVLADLVRHAPPIVYDYDGAQYMLRAPLGMYVLPAAIGRLTGLFAAHMTLIAQNAFVLASILYTLAFLAPRRKAAVLTVFLLFAGLDIIPLVIEAWMRTAHGGAFVLPSVTSAWNEWFSFSNHFTQMFWVPNHALPGWWIAVLALLVARGEIDLGAMAAAVAPLALWSSLSILAAPVLLLYLALRAPVVALNDRRNWLAVFVALLFLPIALYLSSAAETVESEWMIFRDAFWAVYVITMIVQIPHALVLLNYWRMIATSDRGLLLISIAILLIIPVYSFGPSNDLSLRASIAPLAILAFEFSLVATSLDPTEQPWGRFVVL